MPDSLHTSTPVPAPASPTPLQEHGQESMRTDIPLPGETLDFHAADEELMRQTLNSRHSQSSISHRERTQVNLPLAPTDTLHLHEDTVITHNTSSKPGRMTVTMERPHNQTATASPAPTHDYALNDTASWILLGVIALFMLVAIRMHNNFKYLKTLLRQSVEWRERQNMFADTMRERSFTFLLGLLGIVSCGLLLAQGVSLWHHHTPPSTGEFPPGLWLCLGLTGGYYMLQWIAYLIIGNCFTTAHGAAEWVRGFRAGSALLGLALFPAALLGIFRPDVLPEVLILSLTLYGIARFLFIFKGFRIFSGRHAYYLLFLYYLCSVEIVPVLLVWHVACLWG